MLQGFDFGAIFTAAGLAKLGQIIIGDLTMAGDNVVIMGSLASGLPPRDRKKVLMFGVGMALVCLITFAVIATQLLRVTGLVFAGGLLLLWVAYNMWTRAPSARGSVVVDDPETAAVEGPPASKTVLQAAIGIAIADLSMSLDNVLLVASIARDNPALLFIGLTFSVLFMGFAANYVARLIERYSWLNYVGLAVILWVAVRHDLRRLGRRRACAGLEERASARLGPFDGPQPDQRQRAHRLRRDTVHRHRPRRRQCDRRRRARGGAPGRAAQESHPDRRACGAGAANRLCASGHAIAADRRPGAGRRDSTPLGRVADVPRDPAQGRKRRVPTRSLGDEHSGLKPARSFASAAWGVALADVSMSLDNVLAVAGAARDHPWVLVFGLILSVLLMGLAANFIARYIDRYRWIAWVGLS